MVRQGQLPNPRRNASEQRLPGTDGRPFCCVYSYAADNEIVGAECVELDDVFDATECTKLVNDPLDPAAPQRQFGVVAECCRDCELLARKLIIAKCGNRTYLVGGGGVLDSSPVESPEDCCCGDVPRCVQVPGCNQVDCYPEPPDSGDPCEGRCLTMEYDDQGVEIESARGLLCATKVQCCAEDNSSCESRCYDSTIVVVVPGEDPIAPEPTIFGPTNQWTAMACTSDECGVCCEHIYNTDPDSPTYGESIMRIGNTSMSKEECEAAFFDPPIPAIDAAVLGPVGEWIANTDDVNVCNPPCCLDQQFGDAREANCHYTDQLFCDPCVGKCIEIAAENDPGMCPREFCATKQECCGDGGEKCQEGLCGEGEPAIYRWEPMDCVENAADLCGVCCKNEYAVNGQIAGIVCDPGTTTQEQCERTVTIELPPPDDPDAVPPPPLEVQYGTWAPFETCAFCGEKEPCCVELDCPIPELDPGDANNLRLTLAKDFLKAFCGEVPVGDCDPCKGRCKDLVTLAARCKTKQECCGEDGLKCGEAPTLDDVGCGAEPVVAVAEWSSVAGCANPTLCGVCCVNVYDTAGEIITKYCESSLSYEECTQQVEFVDPEIEPKPYGTWVPFETCASHDCTETPRKTCCMPACDPESSDVECRSVIETIECNECAGRCAQLDENGVETGVATCQEKWDCCGQFNELCDPDCGVPAQFSWTPCGDAACGICCLPEGVDPPDPMSAAACIEAGGTWHAYAKDDSVCGPHSCCHEITTVAGRTKTICAPSHEECVPCEGVCTELDQTGGNCPNETCAKKAECCNPCSKCTPVESGGDGTHTWAEKCDYSCPGCCCINNGMWRPDVIYNDAYTCEACCGYGECNYFSQVASCDDCDGFCYDYGPDENYCSSTVNVATCADCACGEGGGTCNWYSTFGSCGVWQPDCAIAQVRDSCGGCYRVRLTGTRPDCQVPGECLANGGPINVDTVICWSGASGNPYRFTNGQNNGYVGVVPTCDGWAAFFYEGSGFFFTTDEPDPKPPPPWYCNSDSPDYSPVRRRQSVYKPLDPDTCDPSYSGDLSLYFLDRTLNPFRLIDTFFTGQFEVTRIENITENDIHDIANTNPFP